MVASLRGSTLRNVKIGQIVAPPVAAPIFTYNPSGSIYTYDQAYVGGTFDATQLPTNGSLTNSNLTANLSSGTGAFITTVQAVSGGVAEFVVGNKSFNQTTQTLYAGFTTASFNPNVPFDINAAQWLKYVTGTINDSWYVMPFGASSTADPYAVADVIAVEIKYDNYDLDYKFRMYLNGVLGVSATLGASGTGYFIVGFCNQSDVDPLPP
jgi:hypothetical protein